MLILIHKITHCSSRCISIRPQVKQTTRVLHALPSSQYNWEWIHRLICNCSSHMVIPIWWYLHMNTMRVAYMYNDIIVPRGIDEEDDRWRKDHVKQYGTKERITPCNNKSMWAVKQQQKKAISLHYSNPVSC